MRVCGVLAPATLLVLCVGCGSHAATPTRAPSPALPPVLLSVGGEAVVTDLSAVRYNPDGTHCVTIGRYADVKAGARVVLSGTSGSRAAVTELGPGTLRGATGTGRPGCFFPFSSANVPNRHPAFLVYVGDQKPVRVTPEALAEGSAVVRFGSGGR